MREIIMTIRKALSLISCLCIFMQYAYPMDERIPMAEPAAKPDQITMPTQELAYVDASMIYTPIQATSCDSLPSSSQSSTTEPTIYIKNDSPRSVRISVGNKFPDALGLLPGQILEFPVRKVSTIKASNYGRYANFFPGTPDTKNMAELFLEHPNYVSKDLIVSVTYDDKSYWFTRLWKLTPRLIETTHDLDGYKCTPQYSDVLYQAVLQCSKSIPEPIARDAALVWSIFTRAAKKIAKNKTVYPFNILGLDSGGPQASYKQLRKWGDILSVLLRKQYNSVHCSVVWEAVDMIIANSIDLLRRYNYYMVLEPDLPETMLRKKRRESTPILEEFPEEILMMLKEKVQGDESATSLVDQVEKAVRIRCVIKACPNSPTPPPPPPPPPAQHALKTTSYQEREITNFLKIIESQNPESLQLVEDTTVGLFKKIDSLNIEHTIAVRLKYAAFEQLRLIEQKKQATRNLLNIKKFMSPAIIRVARNHVNPSNAMKDWVHLLANADQSKAYNYSQMNEECLQQAYVEETNALQNQRLLLEHLKEQIKRFAMTDD